MKRNVGSKFLKFLTVNFKVVVISEKRNFCFMKADGKSNLKENLSSKNEYSPNKFINKDHFSPISSRIFVCENKVEIPIALFAPCSIVGPSW